MKLKVNNQNRVAVIFSSIIAGATISALPSQAATFAVSEGIFEIRLSQNPLEIETLTDTNTVAIAGFQSSVSAEAEAQAEFVADLSSDLDEFSCIFPFSNACNFSLSLAEGEGVNYFGLAQSTAQLVGNFFIEAGEKFSFDFLASLFLETANDNPELERVSALGEISFQIYDSNSWTLLDSFSLFGQLNSFGGNSFLSLPQANENITFNILNFETEFGGNTEFAETVVVGNYSRLFSNSINLTLIETKTNQALVKTTPEPSSILAFLFFLGLARIGLSRSSKQLFQKV